MLVAGTCTTLSCLHCMQSTDANAHADAEEELDHPAIEFSPLLRNERLRCLSAFGWHLFTPIRKEAAVMHLEELRISTWKAENGDSILHAALRGGRHRCPLCVLLS